MHFRELIKRLAAQHTILLSTHILAEVEACCTRVVVVHRGRTVAAESIDDLRQRTAQVTRLRLRSRTADVSALSNALKQQPWAQIIESQTDTVVLDAPANQRDAVVNLAQIHGGLRELIEERRSLEAVFRDLIGEK
jgi:ABC-2 type transport system ATP-binding protein